MLPMLAPYINPLLSANQVRHNNQEELQSPMTLRRLRTDQKRDLRDLRRKVEAKEAIKGLDREVEIFGFTKGSFSLLDLLEACLELTGPVKLIISTWTASRHEILQMHKMMAAGKLLSSRWLVDYTFVRRDPSAANQIRSTFGAESIRVAQNHAKFAVFENGDWKLVLRTSMNLNMNPRYEDFTIQHDPELADFLTTIIDEIWAKQAPALANAKISEIRHHFNHEI